MFSQSGHQLENAFNLLSQEAQELYLPKEIDVLPNILSPFEFHKKYVTPNIPVVFRGAIKHWKAVKQWSIPYLKENLGDKLVDVAITPNGYADAVNKELTENGEGSEDFFITPEEKQMKMSCFLETLENPTENVFYIQKQNSNFENFPELWRDIESHIPWATETFDSMPDAINFWMGDERAITSMHKDHYENIYCVISGEKEFILHPPSDLPWIPHKKYSLASYKQLDSGQWITVPSQHLNGTHDKTSWISVDPLNPNFEKYPMYKNATKISVKVQKGDIFYLPSLWFHHVKQSHGCIAVNYWYDMQYDIKYAYFKFLEAICMK